MLALSNPDPEIHPDVAAKYAAVVATGRSDFPNQINNVLAFPGVFRGALDAGARRITEAMKVAAAEAIFVGGRRRPVRRPDRSERPGSARRPRRGGSGRGGFRYLSPMALRRLAVALVAAVLAGCGGATAPPTVSVGANTDAESALLAHLYAAALRYYGSAAHVEPTPDPLGGLDSGAIGVAPGLTGRLLTTLEPDATARADAQVYRAMVSALPEGVAAGDYTMSAEDKPALAVTESTADAWGGRDVTALERNCAQAVPRCARRCPRPRDAGSLPDAPRPRIS